MFWYWVCVASIGNFIDYAPTRTFTDGADLYQNMFAVERGLHWSPWTLLVCSASRCICPGTLLSPHRAVNHGWLFPRPRCGRGGSPHAFVSSTLMARGVV